MSKGTPPPDRLVSTALLRERRQEIRARIDEQRKVRADSDPFWKITDWLLLEWEQAEKDATREFVPTAAAAEFTGWSPQTLRSKAHKIRSGEDPGPGWEELLVRSSGSEWSFCLATIPVKSSKVA